MFDPIQTPPEPPKIKYQIRISKFDFQNSIFKIQFSKFNFPNSIFQNFIFQKYKILNLVFKNVDKNSSFQAKDNKNIDPAMHNF